LISLQVKNKRISYILDLIFEGRPIVYSMVENQIVLKRVSNPIKIIQNNENPNKLASVPKLPQRTVTGTITDDQGIPIPGVNIVEKGTTNGVAADFDGNYSIEVSSSGSILTFSSIGFATQEIEVGSSSSIDVIMRIDSQTLDEVVVVGYGIQKRKDITGSVASD